MTMQKKQIPAKADQDSADKPAAKPARLAKATIAQPNTRRAVGPAAGKARTINPEVPFASKAPPLPKPPRQTKAALLRERLSDPGGVSLAVLIEAIGWQAHTLRAALSGLRKEGLTVMRHREGDDTIYAIATSGPATMVPTTAGPVTAALAGADAADGADPGAPPPVGGPRANAGAALAEISTDGATA